MPVVWINMLSGRNRDTKKLLLKNVTAAVTSSLGVDPESVRVLINELPPEHYGVAGLPIMEYRTRKSAAAKKIK